MLKHELKHQQIQYLSLIGVQDSNMTAPGLGFRGINGGHHFVIGARINGNVIDRLPGETVDDLIMRIRADADLRGDPANEAELIYED